MVLNKRLAFAAVLLVAALGATSAGCAGTACDKAEKRIDECFGTSSNGSATEGGPAEDCSGAVECQANCYGEFDCAMIKDVIAGKAAGKPLADCLVACGSSG